MLLSGLDAGSVALPTPRLFWQRQQSDDDEPDEFFGPVADKVGLQKNHVFPHLRDQISLHLVLSVRGNTKTNGARDICQPDLTVAGLFVVLNYVCQDWCDLNEFK